MKTFSKKGFKRRIFPKTRSRYFKRIYFIPQRGYGVKDHLIGLQREFQPNLESQEIPKKFQKEL